jgi:hypothetical protein
MRDKRPRGLRWRYRGKPRSLEEIVNSLPPEGIARLMREIPYIARRALIKQVYPEPDREKANRASHLTETDS